MGPIETKPWWLAVYLLHACPAHGIRTKTHLGHVSFINRRIWTWLKTVLFSSSFRSSQQTSLVKRVGPPCFTLLLKRKNKSHLFEEGLKMRSFTWKHFLLNICWLCCDRKSRAGSAQSFTLWQQATIEIMRRRDHSVIACSCHMCMGVVLRAHPVHGEPRIQRNTHGEVATIDSFLTPNVVCTYLNIDRLAYVQVCFHLFESSGWSLESLQ